MRILIPTCRHIYRLVSYGTVVDFEDAVAEQGSTDMLHVPVYPRREQLRLLVKGQAVRPITPPGTDYDVCVVVAMDPYWARSLRLVKDLRKHARHVIVYLFDPWLTRLEEVRKATALWSLVDDLFVSFPHSVEPYQRAVPCRVHYLPQAMEPRWYDPRRTQRPIDLLSVGRRLEPAHQSLLELGRTDDLFYIYQEHLRPNAINFAESQELLGSLSGRSKLQVSWSVSDTSSLRAQEGEAVTARWFEAAASGATVIGSAPIGTEFARLFPDTHFVRNVRELVAEPAEFKRAVRAALEEWEPASRLKLAEHVLTHHTWALRATELLSVLS
jgi:hypothetical protein